MSASTSNTTSRALRRSEKYYLTGGDLYFLVEEVYFRVHSFFFQRESPKFEKHFLHLGLNSAEGAEGASHRTAIVVDITTAAKFEKFLWVFYNPQYSPYVAPLEDWIDILELSSLWSFPEVRALALRELDDIDMGLIERIALYQKYRVDPTVLAPLYASLCEREEMPTLEESITLGQETAIRVFQAREWLRNDARGATSTMSPLPDGVGQIQVMEIIEEVFGAGKGKGRKSNGSRSGSE